MKLMDGDQPKVGGSFDPRMGVLDHGKKCPTDELDNRHCPDILDTLTWQNLCFIFIS